ncbi:MAG TPA: YggS family pyridoxal phosphate-dependent enzyme [Nitrospiria bacterium]|nr:YggS family pyridoxal phosphate-dependent enzyme [Nitrospiria bacterium]
MGIDIKNNLELVRARISKAALSVGRRPGAIRLVAAGKGVGAERLKEAISYGVDTIGENRVQEAIGKIDKLDKMVETGTGLPPHISWHFIGKLQRNKVRDTAGRFDLIHSLDSRPLAEEINKWAEKRGLIQKVLLEVNVGEEETKGGVMPEKALGLIKEASLYMNISVRGLMTVPPVSPDPEGSRIFFRKLSELAKDITKEGIDRIFMEELSMGMSDDFEVAVQEGATMVRIGRAIFGPRRG